MNISEAIIVKSIAQGAKGGFRASSSGLFFFSQRYTWMHPATVNKYSKLSKELAKATS